MKRICFFVMSLLLLLGAAALAEGELKWLTPTIGGNDAVMIVDNGEDWSVRLNLREEPRKGSAIKGRIYTGTRVEVYEDDGEWCLVGLRFAHGNILAGYVMKRYLSPLKDGFPALCPVAVVKGQNKVSDDVGRGPVYLEQGDRAYVLAVCDDEYYVMTPNGQGYIPADACGALEEPTEALRIQYGTFTVPVGGISFVDEYTGEMVTLVGGVVLEDCWQLPGEDVWHVTFGAGVQRTPRVQGTITAEKLTQSGWILFEGEVYALGQRFITCVGAVDGQHILRRTDPNGDIFWAQGDVPKEAKRIDSEICRIERPWHELVSQAVKEKIIEYVVKGRVLDERTSGEGVTQELAARCTLHTALELDPGSGELLRVHAWLEDTDGSYVTGGDLDPRSGAITRWGCNA
ncbi:MAG: SH3 domain-containing protein [Clostridia bacterium]|nr:SH3 domain-containing protein [Clostridia bacterium]